MLHSCRDPREFGRPRGYNPVGESAPDLPQHDATLPGHVPGQYVPIGGGDDWPPSGGTGGARFRRAFGQYVPAGDGNNWASSGKPGLEGSGFGEWSGRLLLGAIVWITLPLQVALYPIAGALGLAAGVAAYVVLTRNGVAHDAVFDWSWMACFAALLPAMCLEIDLERRHPAYRTLRHGLRLALFAWAAYDFDIHDQMDPPQTAAILTLILVVPLHFFLRGRLTMGLWHELQRFAWLRRP